MTNALAPAGHSKLGASSADRWLSCPGSVHAQEGKPNTTSPYAQEGTDLHELAALCLTNDQDAIEYAGRTIGKTEIDEGHVEAVQLYLDAVRNHQRVPGRATVFDAKFGKGVIVEIEKNGRLNPQLGYYALGALDELYGKPAGRHIETRFHLNYLHPLFFGTCDAVEWPGDNAQEVELVVVQPRASHKDGPVRSVIVQPSALMELADDLVTGAEKALAPNPELIPGSHCQFCRAAGSCPAVARKALDIAQLDFDDELVPLAKALPQPADMDNNRIAFLLKAADFLDAWIGAVRAEGLHRAEGGQELQGFKLVDKRGRRRWLGSDNDVAVSLQIEYGLHAQDLYSQKLLSPAQIEKLIEKKDRKSLAAYYDKVSSGKNLVPISDDRPAEIAGPDAEFDEWSE